MKAEARPEHDWLRQMAGEWTYESECVMGPGGEKSKATGREVVRAIGDVWIVGEMTSPTPDGTDMICVMTLGFDPTRDRFVGSWIGTPMPQLVVYEGRRDATGNVLTLDCEGPSFDDPTRTAKYQDIIEIKSRDHRLFTSQVLGEDGKWFRFMEGEYRRVT